MKYRFLRNYRREIPGDLVILLVYIYKKEVKMYAPI